MPPKETPATPVKLNFADIINKVKENQEGAKKPFDFGTVSDLEELGPDDYLKLGDWWSKPTNLPGLPFGRMVLIAGDSDSGKSSFAIQSIKAAQQQGVGTIYIETENKTTAADFVNWGVDPQQIIMKQSFVLEQMFETAIQAWDEIVKVAPNAPLLIVIDSMGNTVTQFDEDLDLTDNTKPGGKGSALRRCLNKLAGKLINAKNKVSVLLISYTYDNIGSPGRTNAGGKALGFFPSLIYQTKRIGWMEKTESGNKVRVGAKVKWDLFKNHLKKTSPGLKNIVFGITDDGMSFVEKDSE
jgi:RecA/RadA recombinase